MTVPTKGLRDQESCWKSLRIIYLLIYLLEEEDREVSSYPHILLSHLSTKLPNSMSLLMIGGVLKIIFLITYGVGKFFNTLSVHLKWTGGLSHRPYRVPLSQSLGDGRFRNPGRDLKNLVSHM